MKKFLMGTLIYIIFKIKSDVIINMKNIHNSCGLNVITKRLKINKNKDHIPTIKEITSICGPYYKVNIVHVSFLLWGDGTKIKLFKFSL